MSSLETVRVVREKGKQYPQIRNYEGPVKMGTLYDAVKRLTEVDQTLRDAAINILELSYLNISDIFDRGGLITDEGDLSVGFSIPTAWPMQFKVLLEKWRVVFDRSQGYKKFGVELEELGLNALTPHQFVTIVNPGTDKLLFQHRRVHIEVGHYDNKLIRNTINYSQPIGLYSSLVRHVKNLYRDGNTPELVASPAVVQSALLEIAYDSGLGYRSDLPVVFAPNKRLSLILKELPENIAEESNLRFFDIPEEVVDSDLDDLMPIFNPNTVASKYMTMVLGKIREDLIVYKTQRQTL